MPFVLHAPGMAPEVADMLEEPLTGEGLMCKAIRACVLYAQGVTGAFKSSLVSWSTLSMSSREPPVAIVLG